MILKLQSSRYPIVIALISGNGLLLTPDGSVWRVIGALILFLLPGLAWADRRLHLLPSLTGWMVGCGLSYSLVMISGLILHYLPGPLPFWAELITLNFLALLPLLLKNAAPQPNPHAFSWRLSSLAGMLVIILFFAAFFRFANLGHNEFHEDELEAMHPAAEALVGHQDALFVNRRKGPGEVLLPMMFWGLTGTINELTARLPFAVAGLLIFPTLYKVGERLLLNKRAGLAAAGLLALNGMMVAFSQIVQFPVMVVWMSALALLCIWEWREQKGTPWMLLSGIFLGTGLLSHYASAAVIPALVYGVISAPQFWPINRGSRVAIRALLLTLGCLMALIGLFYLPYTLNPQATRTLDYLVNSRIGLKFIQNNLGSFLQFNVFFNSFYYLVLTGLLVLGFLAWAFHSHAWVRRIPAGAYWVPGLVFILALGLTIRPNALLISGLDLIGLPFAFIFLGAFLAPSLTAGQRAVVVWLAVSFFIYNFVIAKPGAHLYIITPGWTIVAGLAAIQVWDSLTSRYRRARATRLEGPALAKIGFSHSLSASPFLFLGHPMWLMVVPALISALITGYLYLAYLRQEPEFEQIWPDKLPALYWSPYNTDLPLKNHIFGLPYQRGWKAIGALFANNQLNGDYSSNEKLQVTRWYLHTQLPACGPQLKYYFSTGDPSFNFWDLNANILKANYEPTGQVALSNGHGITIFQLRPAAEKLGQIDPIPLINAFDRAAFPATFAYARRESRSVDVTLAGPVKLVGYELNALQTQPNGQIEVILYWQPQGRLAADYHVFVHLEGDGAANSPSGVWGQSDGRPACQFYPTFDWQPQELIPDPHVFKINPDTPPGEYGVLVGMYAPDTGTRLDVLDEGGQPAANFVKLTTLAIQ